MLHICNSMQRKVKLKKLFFKEESVSVLLFQSVKYISDNWHLQGKIPNTEI